MSMQKIRYEAEEAWREGKDLYLVQLTEMPSFRDPAEPEVEEVEPWKDKSLPSEERVRLRAQWQDDRRVMSQRMTEIEESIEAIVAVGWELRDLRFVDYSITLFQNSKVTLNRVQVAFARPAAAA